jgi:two-component system, response regulator PdtaR
MGTQNYSPRILVVEDDAAIRRLTSYTLRNAGFEVLEACTADEGLARISADKVDALITDVEMPGTLDGYDLAWQAHVQLPTVPVFVISGSIEPDQRELPPQARFFSKPVDPWLLLAQLHAALISTEQERSRAVA